MLRQVRCLTFIILATWEAEIGRIEVQGCQLGQKVCKTPSQSVAGHCGVHLLSQLHREAQEGLWSRPEHKVELYLKNNHHWAGGVIQVVEHLLSKHEALGSNPVPKNKQAKKERKKL
jgi:hypothetical protein